MTDSNWIPAPPGLTAITRLRNSAAVIAIDPEHGQVLLDDGKTESFLNTGVVLERIAELNWVPAPAGWRAVFGYTAWTSAEEDVIRILPVVAFGLPVIVNPIFADYDIDYAVIDREMREGPTSTARAMRQLSNITAHDYLVPPGQEPPLDEVRAELAEVRAKREARDKARESG